MLLPRVSTARSLAGRVQAPVFLLLAFASATGAQQFTQSPGAIPGVARWSEGVEASDVDRDGDHDLFFADGEGFSSPGTKRQNVLVINLFESAPGTFADESLARLGSHLSHAKQVTTGDLTGDGYDEALFSNAFQTDPPFLYVNAGAADPGVFSFEGAARGFAASFSSGSAQFGDLDDDGDLDVLISDAYLGSPTGKPHLFVNDGQGFFAEDPAFQAALPNKSAQMDVQLVDIDGDFDLDVLTSCRAENGSGPAGDHYLIENLGGLVWMDRSELVPDGQSNSVYEVEVGDLDGDTDLDLFFVSLSSFRDGPMSNDLEPSGSLGFTVWAAQGGDDDNEVALFDYDDDGDLDALIGSLGPREKVFRNDGGLGFTQLNGVVQSISDSTLDATVVDLDNDGAYDIVTAQGESNASQWANKVYFNTGPADSRAPVVVATDGLSGRRADGTWVLHASVSDAVIDDGKTWVQGEARFVATTTPADASVDIGAGGWSNDAVSIATGASVTWTNLDASPHSVVGQGADFAFDSGSLAQGEAFTWVFVTSGPVAISDGVGSAGAAEVDVLGVHQTTESLAVGGLHRFALSDPGGAADVLAWELAFTDAAGNRTVTPAQRAPLASAALRTAATNPLSYSVSTPPVFGADFEASVDLNGTTGHGLAVLFGFDTATNLALGGGQVVLALDLGGAGELLAAPTLPGPTAVFSLAVPSDPVLIGFPLATQALHIGTVTPFALSNAQDLVVGY